MKLTIYSEPQGVLDAFRPFLAPLYEAFEVATPRAYDVIEQYGWTPSPQLFSHMTRADVKARLNGKPCPVEYDDEIRILQMDNVSMEGLAATVDGVDFKIMKGEILRPALSAPRGYFYQQSNENLWAHGEIPELKSLVVLWECDLHGQGLSLYLVCPKSASGEYVWRILVPPPADWMIVSEPTPGSGGDLGGGDLDIEKQKPGEDTKEQG